jgi:type I restriction enzyme S subunit
MLLPYLRAANIRWSGIDDSDIKTMWFSTKDRENLRLQVDDLLVSEGGDVGRSALWKGEIDECYFQNSVNRVRPGNGNLTSFLRYWMSTMKDKGFIDVLCNKSTIAHFTAEKVGAVPVPFPPVAEQAAIATFLDLETAKIDALIAEQQRLIELLQEKRQAVISHAVTKGLNPDAPMKDSGVEWLGEVPEHWDVTPLKYLSEIKAGFAFKSDEFTDSGVPVLRIGDIGRDGTVDFCDAKYLAAEALDDHSDVLVKHGDIVMAMTGATIGKAARYTAAEPALLNQRVCIFRARHPESQPYVWFALATHYYAEYLTITAFGGAQPNISDSELVACHVPIPPVKERVDIAMRLSEDMANMVVLETEAQQAISLLQERRSALISAAVTGQIDVRGLVPEAVAA